ncbi:MAG TPA: glutathione S-transferase N-terminal domain-containing protein, partial [Thiopseudomonas sp.]|nr:glutathione S-transferase N-terminal domain-containing protein [Thiopseudomonas sp.]
MTSSLHRLYSFRRCPYAMRARLGLLFAELQVELREIVLRNKPAQMLAMSPKGTVPVLQLCDGTVIEESREIMVWALEQHDPQGLLDAQVLQQANAL